MDKVELSERISSLLNKYRDDLFFGEDIHLLHRRINHVVSSLVVVGQFSVGKSELLNALLGEKLLAARRIESTKVTTLIHKCEEDQQKKIILHYKNGDTSELSIKDIETLDQYTTFQGNGHTEELLSVDVYWPLKFLNHEITLVDTPGANSLTGSAFAVTEKELEKAASVIYLFNGQKGIDQIDLSLLMDLVNRRKKVFIVASHIDSLTEEELATVIESVQGQLAAKITGSQLMKIYPVSSTEALRAKQQGNQALIEQSNIMELEQALLTYMQNQEYLASELQSIQYDLQKLEESILESEKELLEEQAEKDRQRHLRIERLQLLTKREFDSLREDGFQLLEYREKRLHDLLEQWKEQIEGNNKEYKKEIAASFRSFRKEIMQKITFSSIADLEDESQKLNEVLNLRYEGIVGKFKEIVNLLPAQVESLTLEEDTLFIENLEANKQGLQLNWPLFRQQINQMVLNQRSIEYDKGLFIQYKQNRADLEGACADIKEDINNVKKSQDRLVTNNKQSIQRLKENHDQKVINLGNMPDPIANTKTTGILWWKKEEVVGYDYSNQKKWQEELKKIHQDYKNKEGKTLHEFKNASAALKKDEEKLNDELEIIKLAEDDLKRQLMDQFFESIEDQENAAQSFYRQVEEEINALWKAQENNTIQQFHHHTDNVRKQFIHFVDKALQAQLYLIK